MQNVVHLSKFDHAASVASPVYLSCGGGGWGLNALQSYNMRCSGERPVRPLCGDAPATYHSEVQRLALPHWQNALVRKSFFNDLMESFLSVYPLQAYLRRRQHWDLLVDVDGNGEGTHFLQVVYSPERAQLLLLDSNGSLYYTSTYSGDAELLADQSSILTNTSADNMIIVDNGKFFHALSYPSSNPALVFSYHKLDRSMRASGSDMFFGVDSSNSAVIYSNGKRNLCYLSYY